MNVFWKNATVASGWNRKRPSHSIALNTSHWESSLILLHLAEHTNKTIVSPWKTKQKNCSRFPCILLSEQVMLSWKFLEGLPLCSLVPAPSTCPQNLVSLPECPPDWRFSWRWDFSYIFGCLTPHASGAQILFNLDFGDRWLLCPHPPGQGP